jgi:hypothetical protein
MAGGAITIPDDSPRTAMRSPQRTDEKPGKQPGFLVTRIQVAEECTARLERWL